MRLALDRIAEQRILNALAAGELNSLCGLGRRLYLDDDALVPEALRAAYRVMKNAGVVPEEVQLRRSIAELEAVIASTPHGEQRRRAERWLSLLNTRMEGRGGLRVPSVNAGGSAVQVMTRFSRHRQRG